MRPSVQFAANRNLFFLVALCSAASHVDACTCRKDTPKEGLVNADLVFMAEVHGANVFGSPDKILTSVDFELISVKKGERTTIPKRLMTSNWSGHCGMKVSVPERYWFFTDKDGYFDGCTATAPILDERFLTMWKDTKRGLIEWFRRQAAEMRREDELKGHSP